MTQEQRGDGATNSDTEDMIAIRDPRCDSEAMLLSGMLFAAQNGGRKLLEPVANNLTAEEFCSPHYRQVYATMMQLLDQDRLPDPASIVTCLVEQGAIEGMHREDATNLLTKLLGLQAEPFQIVEYARQVASYAYRRQFAEMVSRLEQIAKEAPEDRLFSHMVAFGCKQRSIWKKYADREWT